MSNLLMALPLIKENITEEFIELIKTFKSCNLTLKEVENTIALIPNNIQIYIAIYQNKLAACGTLIIEQKLIHDGGKVAHIEDIIVHPEYRKLGIGKFLVEYMLDEAQRKKCYKAILNCDDIVCVFYEKIGLKKQCIQMRKNLEV